MRVCFIEDTLLHGGTQIWVTEASDHLISQGIDVTLLAPENSWVVEQCWGKDIRITSYAWEEIGTSPNEYQQRWIDALADADVAVCTVHPPRTGFHCVEFAGECIRQAGLSTHLIAKAGTIVPSYQSTFYIPNQELNCSVIAITDFTRKYLIDTYSILEDKAELIYQGVDVSRFDLSIYPDGDQSVQTLLPDNASLVLGCVGSYEERKGQKVLFEALAILKAGSLPGVHLLMVGDGPDEGRLKQLASVLNIANRIHFVPFTKYPETIYPLLDLTILPSLYKEGMPNVLLESLAMGVPVISSDIGGVREVVLEGKTGKVVPIGDSSALASAIKAVWQDQKKYHAMKEYSPGFIRENYDKDKQFAQFLEHYKKVSQQE